MRQFTVYEVSTGKILKVLTQSKEPVLKDGQGFIEGDYPDDRFDIVDDQPVENVKNTARVPPTEEAGVKEQQTPEGSVRFQRDILLQRSDWTQLPDSSVDKQAWVEYRQALRDVPQQAGFPDNIVWPTPPE